MRGAAAALGECRAPNQRDFRDDEGGVPVSTGTRKLEQRADAPGILKTGNYKLKNNDEFVPVAA